MNEFKNKIKKIYDKKKLSSKEIEEIMNEAVKNNIIDKNNIKTFENATIDTIITYLEKFDRNSLIIDNDNFQKDINFQLNCSEDYYQIDKDKIIDAYMKYEEKTRIKGLNWYQSALIYIFLNIGLFGLLYGLYTNQPY